MYASRRDPHRGKRWRCFALGLSVITFAAAPSVRAQLVTVGGGALVTERGTEAVAELHGESPPLGGGRAYATLSWTRESAAPTIITAWEYPVLTSGRAFTGLGAGLLMLEVNDYRPEPMLVSSSVFPLPVPRTSFVVIASMTPFDDFDWSLVFKVGVTAVFVR